MPTQSTTLLDEEAKADQPASDVVARLVASRSELLAFLERRLGRRDLAEDVLQDAFAKGIDRVGSLRDDESALALVLPHSPQRGGRPSAARHDLRGRACRACARARSDGARVRRRATRRRVSVRAAARRHGEEANKHRKMAADHRAGSQALRDAEAGTCTGISDNDRDMSPFDHAQDIAGVEPLTVGTTAGKAQLVKTEGAIVTFRALPGMTAQWLQRVVDCHLARNAALEHDVPEMAYWPLFPKA